MSSLPVPKSLADRLAGGAWGHFVGDAVGVPSPREAWPRRAPLSPSLAGDAREG